MNVKLAGPNGTGIAREVLTLREAMDRLFEDSVVPEMRSTGRRGVSLVPVDAWEDENHLVLEVALPGLTAEAVDVTVEQDSLTIAGTFPERDEARPWLIRERAQGHFERRLTLNLPVEVDEIAAEMKNGILTITVPKSESVKPRKIAVAVN